jgi:hypothetical protein
MHGIAAMLSGGTVTAMFDDVTPYDQIFLSSTILLACGFTITPETYSEATKRILGKVD